MPVFSNRLASRKTNISAPPSFNVSETINTFIQRCYIELSNYFKLAETTNHIVILCSRLDLPGGIERAVVNTANLFTRNGHFVTLVILDETKEIFYPLEGSVSIVQEPLSFGITSKGNFITRKLKMFNDITKLDDILKKQRPGFVITTEYPFTCALTICGQKKRSMLMAWEHHHFYELKKNKFWEKFYREACKKMHAFICLNPDEQKYYSPLNPNTVVIPNFISPGDDHSSLSNKTILTVARLVRVKGIDLLLQAAKMILHQHPGWQWKLIGDGEMKEEVMDFIERENLQGKLLLQPPVDHEIISEYKNASLYAMTSRNECFPMTLLEAQSAGLPCIAFDCETGPRHIIINNENGLLVENGNTSKFAEAISTLITNEEDRKKMGEKAVENIQRFSPEKIYSLWKQVMIPVN